MNFYTDPELATMDLLASSGTNSIVDRKRAVCIIRYGESCGKRDEAVAIVRASRRRWLDWLTLTQRKWQDHSRRPARANHHDSIQIREQYVRCGVAGVVPICPS